MRHIAPRAYLTPVAVGVLSLGLFASTIAAPAAELDTGAGQIVGLFMRACVPQYGDIYAVRKWLEDRKVPRMPDAGAVHFLNGRSGTVYDASNATGRYGVTTLDNGVCDAFAETALGWGRQQWRKGYGRSRGRIAMAQGDHQPKP
jgi:hypothetical protein